MSSSATPAVRVDREWAISVQLQVTEQILYRCADMINAMTKTGAIYTQILLGPEMAEAKRQMLAQQQEQV